MCLISFWFRMLAGVARLDHRNIYNSFVFRDIPHKETWPLVAYFEPKKPAPKGNEERRESGGQREHKPSTIFAANPEFYVRSFHLAVARIRYWDGLGLGTPHTYFNLYEPNGAGKYLDLHSSGDK